MKYLIIEDYGYEGYHPKWFDSLDAVAEEVENYSECHIHGIYKIEMEIPLSEIQSLIEMRKATLEADRAAALNKLTDYEKSLLGVCNV